MTAPVKCRLKSCSKYGRRENMRKAPLGWFCDVGCEAKHGLERSRKAQESRRRAEKREGRAKLKSRGDWLREAQGAFNAYIRERDKGLACVSCGQNTGCKMNAGHYRSVGSMPALRFETLNCWLQCERCNSYLSGNQIEYRKELLRRIGPEKLEWLEGPHDAKKYTIDQIMEIKSRYAAAARELKSVTPPLQQEDANN